MNALQKTALVFTIIGAINWGLIGLFNFNLVDSLFGQNSFLSMLIYIIVGIAGLINIMLFFTDLNIKEELSYSISNGDICPSLVSILIRFFTIFNIGISCKESE